MNVKAKISRSICPSDCVELWARAAGRCSSCNRLVYRTTRGHEKVSHGQKAHIRAFSSRGPRGNTQRRYINRADNLILLCHECHKKIDKKDLESIYLEKGLREMKERHERRVELVTGISPDKSTHIVLYGSNIGENKSPLSYHEAASALIPHRYPAEAWSIDLSMKQSAFTERDEAFFRQESRSLEIKFGPNVRERLSAGEIRHLSVFAIAPQPLLVKLGTLLSDIPDTDTYQLHREPYGWDWRSRPRDISLVLTEPNTVTGPPALILSLSASITLDRVAAVLGKSFTPWILALPKPHNDFLQSRTQLARFRRDIRPVMDRIKSKHGQNSLLHVFPATPVAIAVELGRIRQPKADLAWRIYDQVNGQGGFIKALDINQE